MGSRRTHYDVLGVAVTASHDQIRRAFLGLVRSAHPDSSPPASGVELEERHRAMSEITEAWRVLGDPDSRRDYDLTAGTWRRRTDIDAHAWHDRPDPPEGFELCPAFSVYGRAGTDRPYMRYPDDVYRALSLRATQPDLSALSGSLRIWKLDASFVPVVDDQLAHLTGQRDLRVLDLSGTELVGEGLSHVAELPRLRELHLFATGLTDEGLRAVGTMTRLQALRLTRTSVTDEGLAHLAGLDQLRSLDLRRTRVRGPGLRHLARLARLEEVTLPARLGRGWRAWWHASRQRVVV